MAECQRCTRTDLNLTQNGRVKSHAADGKRAHPETNPHCPGGSDWPKEHVRALAEQGDAASVALLTAWGEETVDNRPTAQDVRDAELAMRAPDAPDDVMAAAEEVLNMASTYGVRDSARSVVEGPNPYGGTSGERIRSVMESLGPNPYRAPLPTGMVEALAQGWTEEQWWAAQGGGSDVATAGDGSWTDSKAADVIRTWPRQAGKTQPPSSPETTGDPTTGPSSTQGTAPTATTASSKSTKETSSVVSETETTSMPTASKTGSANSEATDVVNSIPANDATAFVNSPPQASNAVPRDRWGRYLLPHPDTGTTQPWTRTTTMAGSVADTFALSMWQQRMAVKGLTMRPDLYALASTFDVSADKDDLNSVCEQARSAAGDKVAANLGTAMHAFTATVDKGGKANIPPTMQSDVDAYSAVLRAYGLEIVPQLIERRVVLTRKTAGEDIGGTFDRVYRAVRDVDLKMADNRILTLPAGSYVIGDLKTGRDLSYGWGEIAIQETIYAHAINENGVWDPEGKEWDRLPLGYSEGGDGPEPRTVREDVGIVVHLPIQKKAGAPACVLYAVDLKQGWEALELCVKVRQWRKRKQIASPLGVVDQPTAARAPLTTDDIYPGHDADAADRKDARGYELKSPGFDRPTAAQVAGHPSVDPEAAARYTVAPRPPTWEERAQRISTRAEASALYQEMRPKVGQIGMARFNAVVKMMQTHLATLEEKAG